MKTKTIIIKHTQITKCEGNCINCSVNFCNKLSVLGLNLVWDSEKKIPVNGAITIDHGFGIYDEDGNYLRQNEVLRPHTLRIEIYEEDDDPNIEHESIMKKPSKIPTEQECIDCLT
jgi:hypothetical protein